MEEKWGDFRRTLRCSEQAAFDRLFEHARTHADAGGVQNHPSTEETILLSISLEQQLRIDDLEDRLDHLEDDLETDHRQP